MPAVTHALIHRARVVKAQRATTRNEQGEYETTQVYGPWFPARRMTRRPAREARERVEAALEAKLEVGQAVPRQQLRQRLEETCRTCAEHGCLDCTCGRSTARPEGVEPTR